MARPTLKSTPIYRRTNGGGLYRITYQAVNGAKRPGIPHDDMTDIINLTKVGGPTSLDNPPFIVTSEADFKASFTLHNPIQSTTSGTAHRPGANEATKE